MYASLTTFPTRWRITGTLTTKTSLRIGSGETTDAYKDVLKNDENQAIKVDAVVLDVTGQPYIPATALKGNLRAWLKNRSGDESLLTALFGSETQEQEVIGGKVNFFDATLSQPLENPAFPPSYWSAKRQANVVVGVTIDRDTRTAMEKHLFHREVVPPNTTFSVHMTAQGLEKQEVALLLAGLEGFNDVQAPVTIGSDTAQNQGKFAWQLEKIECIDAEKAKKWLEQNANEMWFNSFEPIDYQEFHDLIPQLISKHATLQLNLELIFDSPFLVNDPSLYQKDKTPNHQPKRDLRGHAILPARSIRGAIRTQAERIIRTLGGKAGFLADKNEVKDGDLAAQLFGTTEWKTPISISDFTLVENTGIPFHQEFVSIDRFTGGSGDGLKFNAASVYKPTFTGQWSIDLERIEPWGLGLLALVIRDLCEGDITFGFGAAKGYGRCHGTLKNWSLNQIGKVAGKFTLTEDKKSSLEKRELSEIKILINELVTKFRDKVGVIKNV